MKQIKCKFAPFVLVPHEAIVGTEPGAYVTMDGNVCDANFLGTWDNRDGRYDNELDAICMKHWNMSFSSFKSFWYERCWRIEGYWHYVELKIKEK